MKPVSELSVPNGLQLWRDYRLTRSRKIDLNRPWTCCEIPSEIYSITIDMTTTHDISGLIYAPVPNQNVYVESYTVEISPDGESWEVIESGTFGNIRNDPSARTLFFDISMEGRYVRLTNLTPPGGVEIIGVLRIEILP